MIAPFMVAVMVYLNPVNGRLASFDPPMTGGRFYSMLVKAGVKHPEIALAQAMLESGNFKSMLFTENHNAFGMKHPRNRATTSTGERNGYASYTSAWSCAVDYALWQSSGKSPVGEDYYAYLVKMGYCKSPGYIKALKNVVSMNKKRGVSP